MLRKIIVTMGFLIWWRWNLKNGPGLFAQLSIRSSPGDVKKWKCEDGQKIIDTFQVCDKSASCMDGSDEDPAMCSQWNCTDGRWKCKDGLQCIEPFEVCNGDNDCTDKSEEDPAMCANWKCNPADTV